MDTLRLDPIDHLAGTVTLPGSKSISNRALLLAAQAEGETELHNLLRSEDTEHMIEALTELGVNLTVTGTTARLTGRGGPLVREPGRHSLYLGLAGTALRPLTAALTLGRGEFVLDGSARMRERPIADLVDALALLGARIHYLGEPGFPPLEVFGTGLDGGTTRIRGDVSSQFLTALLMAAPMADDPVRVRIEGELVSKPYLDITLHMMRRFGAAVDHRDYQVFEVQPGRYRSPGRFLVEGDASSASYFLAAGAIRGPGVTVHGIGSDSVQGDVRFTEVLEAMGARVQRSADAITVQPPASGRLRGVDLDLNHIPDAAMTVAMLALFADGPTAIRNVGNWRVKETDRLDAMTRELLKLGAVVEEGPDYLEVAPPIRWRDASIDTYGDHRMAMCFSLAALGPAGVTIRDPDCVAKTFPDYFTRFRTLIPAAA
ncbi:MAG: 3-phosphoshikimate 1-carboxyvinyltransferase [Gammaproteobacteria bacterium]|nr:3-phosphoshikimate 1-carboxyvinyltransferase [Gammaproteobacteria bacterium]|tara:strand:+ start:1046 stop:2338 length:1293 start_codon:yes stop_codon:yes gene_type:complete